MSTMENGNLNRNSGTPRTPLTHAQKYIRQQQQLKQQHQQQNSLYSSPASQLPPNAQERQQPQMGQTKIKGSQPHPMVYENGHPLNANNNNNGNHHHQHQQPQQIYENVNLQQQQYQQQPQTQQRNSQQLLQNQNHPQPKLDRNSSPLQSAPQRQLHHHPQQQQQQQQQRPQQQQPPLTQQQKQQQQHLLPPLEPLPFEDDDTPPSSPPGRPKSRSSEPGLIPATPHLRRRLTRRMKYTPARYKDEEEYIGFATLPEQVHRKAVRKGFDFTLMVVGESGLGKSTLINSLFLSELYKDRDPVGVNDLIQRTVNIEKKQIEIEEKGVRLKLTIVDTPGFNDTVNADNCHKTLIDYVDEQFKQFYDDESGLNRRNIVDNRVHCCLYFISPYGHGLKPIDVETMKKLHHKVNIVPLLAKSDILTKQEIKRMKDRILKEVEEHEIRIYQFPDCDSDEDDDFKQQDRELKASIPFAVVGCNTVVEAGGKKIRGRAYPWGIVEVDNPNHCDFVRLRQMLISTHMQDLKDITSDVHYENYRAVHIRSQMGSTQKERSKLKRDSAPNIEAVADAEKLLEAKDAEIQRMQKMLAQMQAQLTGGKQNGV